LSFFEQLRELAAKINAAAASCADWAASETGQQVLLGMDLLAVFADAGRFFAHTGWYLPASPHLYRYALEEQHRHAPFDPRAAARLVSPESAHWTWIAEGLRASPSLASRVAVFDDGVYCVEQARWHAAVSTLLPLIEGIVGDHSGVLKNMAVPRRLNHLLHSENLSSFELTGLVAVPALQVLDSELFARRDFEEVTIHERALNRHLVLHGRIAGFGTETNALRTLMVIAALVELFDGPLLLRAPSPETLSVDLLDDFGPLASLRAAALSRAARASEH
jgi:hypothetical protein